MTHVVARINHTSHRQLLQSALASSCSIRLHLDGFAAFSISVKLYQPTLANNGIVRKFLTAGQKSYQFYVTSGGVLFLSVSNDGTNNIDSFNCPSI